MAKLAYSQVCAHIHKHRKTVKTNKLVIGIMVIQLIFVSSVRLIEGNENCENVCLITHFTVVRAGDTDESTEEKKD